MFQRKTIFSNTDLFNFFFISADGGCAVAPSSIAPFSELEPILLCPSFGEIQFHHQSVVPAISTDWLIPSGLFLFSLSISHASPSQSLLILSIVKIIIIIIICNDFLMIQQLQIPLALAPPFEIFRALFYVQLCNIQFEVT